MMHVCGERFPCTGRARQHGGSMHYTMALYVRVLLLFVCVLVVLLHTYYNRVQRQMPWLEH